MEVIWLSEIVAVDRSYRRRMKCPSKWCTLGYYFMTTWSLKIGWLWFFVLFVELLKCLVKDLVRIVEWYEVSTVAIRNSLLWMWWLLVGVNMYIQIADWMEFNDSISLTLVFDTTIAGQWPPEEENLQKDWGKAVNCFIYLWPLNYFLDGKNIVTLLSLLVNLTSLGVIPIWLTWLNFIFSVNFLLRRNLHIW